MHNCAGALGNNAVSYSATHQRVAAKVTGYADKYNQFVVDYALEWDKVVTARVTAGLKNTDVLRRDLDHYQKKVEELRTQSNKILAKGKMVDDKTAEKLKRNEEKLGQAKEIYNRAARDMCMLLEETSDRSWKDLHPILVKMAQFDMTLANDEAKGLAEMESVVTALKALAIGNDLKASGRLKELAAQEPSILYSGTNSGTVALTNGDVSSQIEGMSLGSSAETSLPPGSVAPQGMGGFPVQIYEAPASSNEKSRELVVSPPSSGNLSWHSSVSAPTTSEMLTLASSAAPPPTLDQINDVSGFNRNSSVESFGSYRSGPPPHMGPPPFSPPPPPPSESPSGTSGYEYYNSMTSPQASAWSAPPPMNQSYMSPSYATPNTNPFGQPPSYGMPPPVSQNTNPFGPPPGSYPPSSNPFAY
jgi:hypothetical protein